jgi:hypothetical protein
VLYSYILNTTEYGLAKESNLLPYRMTNIFFLYMPSDILLNHSLAIREFQNFAAICRYRVKIPAEKRFWLKLKENVFILCLCE